MEEGNTEYEYRPYQRAGPKGQKEGLTDAEKAEQAKLRQEYIAAVRMNLRTQLDNINIQEQDGSITNVGEKYGPKKDIRKRVFALRREASEQKITENSETSGRSVIWPPTGKQRRYTLTWTTTGRS